MNKANETRKQIEELLKDDDIFVKVVDELDRWDGYADGYSAYPMDELDDIYYGITLHDFLERITDGFNINDNYFYPTIYGIESTNDKVELYRNNASINEVIDEITENYYQINLRWIDNDLNELVEQYIDERDNEQ